MQVEIAINSSFKGGVSLYSQNLSTSFLIVMFLKSCQLLFAVCGGVLFGTAEVVGSFRGKKDNLNYAAGGVLAGLAGTLVSQNYSLKAFTKKCVGLTVVGVVYSHLRNQLSDFERHLVDTGAEKSTPEKIVQLFTPPFVYRAAVNYKENRKKVV